MTDIIDSLHIKISNTRELLGKEVAKDVYETIQTLLSERSEINIIFAAAPSQIDLYSGLLALDIPWERINAFHMDEYLGIEHSHPQSFRHYLDTNLFNHVPLKSVNYIRGEAIESGIECSRYADLLDQFPPDIVCMGIGENTHLAFNDPPANLEDDQAVKEVKLDEMCRQQQVNDGCFLTLDLVPKSAMTLTIPTLMSAKYVFCVVPGIRKADAVKKTLEEEISGLYPSTILRTHLNAILYLDKDSSSLINI